MCICVFTHCAKGCVLCYAFEYHVLLCYEFYMSRQLSGWPSCVAKTSFGHCRQFYQPNFFIPAMMIGTLGFYHFVPFSLTLTLAGDHKVCAKQNLLASFSGTLFI